MAIYAKAAPTPVPAPEGLHSAVCVDVVDLGLVDTSFGKKEQVRLVFQIADLHPTTGKRLTVTRTFTNSLSKKANLRQALQSWRGRPFEPHELDGTFDLERLVGVPAQVQVVHVLGENGQIYGNLEAIVPLGKGMTPLGADGYTREPARGTVRQNAPALLKDPHVEPVPFERPPVRRHTDQGRVYVLDDGTALPSVTTILSAVSKPALVTWAANSERALCLEAAGNLYDDVHGTPKMSRASFVASLARRLGDVKAHQRELQKATAIGSQTHALIEWSLKRALGQVTGPEPRVQDEAQWGYMAFEDWCKGAALEPLFVESVVWSRPHGYAGTCDLVARRGDALVVVDFKTGKRVYPEALLQVVAYQQALLDMGHPAPAAGYVVRVPKNPDDPAFEVVAVPPREALLPVFLAVRDVWRWASEADRRERDAWQAARATARAKGGAGAPRP